MQDGRERRQPQPTDREKRRKQHHRRIQSPNPTTASFTANAKTATRQKHHHPRQKKHPSTGGAAGRRKNPENTHTLEPAGGFFPSPSLMVSTITPCSSSSMRGRERQTQHTHTQTHQGRPSPLLWWLAIRNLVGYFLLSVSPRGRMSGTRIVRNTETLVKTLLCGLWCVCVCVSLSLSVCVLVSDHEESNPKSALRGGKSDCHHWG